jgi:diguanylate cyclase (GGDEF)-like protein
MVMPRLRLSQFSLRLALVLLVMLALSVAAVLAVGRLQSEATKARDAQLTLTSLRLDVAQIQQVPWGAAPGEGDSPADVHDELLGDQQQIKRTLAGLSRGGDLPERARLEAPFNRTMAALWQILRLVSKGDSDQTNKPSDIAARQAYKVDQELQKAAARNRGTSLAALDRSRLGSAAAILLLFLAFAVFYVRATRARRRLLAASQAEALTDALTGLGNRRALITDLERVPVPSDGRQTLVALFDLDGFKLYNDTFGHPAGDAVLQLLGGRLAEAMNGHGRAYRMGGDEFCVLASVDEAAAEEVAHLAASALVESGVGFSIACSFGAALMPRDATAYRDALRLADERMYEHKRGLTPLGQSRTTAA